MNKILGLLVLLPGVLFIVTGLRWLVDPAGVAPEIGVEILVATILLVASRRLAREA